MSPSEAEGHLQGGWAESSVCMRNGNDFWVILVLGYLHLLLPAFTQALGTDELRQEPGAAGKVTFLVSPGRPPGHKLPRTVFW